MRYSEDGITEEAGSMYVWLDCDRYGLPDTTMGKTGKHAVYLPTCTLPADLRAKCCKVALKADALEREARVEREKRASEADAAWDARNARLRAVRGSAYDPEIIETEKRA